MSLRKVGRYNDLPADIKPPKLDKGQVASYRFLWGYTDPIPKRNFMGGARRVPSFSTLFDREKNVIEIGMVGAVDHTGAPRRETVRKFWMNSGDDGGKERLDVTGGSAEATTLFEYLELASFVKGNYADKEGLRDESVTPILERIDYEGEAKAKTDAAKKRAEAIAKAYGLEGEHLRVAALVNGVNVDESRTPDEVKADLLEVAEADPTAFLESTAHKHAETMALLADAQRLGVLEIDHDASALVWVKGRNPALKVGNTGDQAVAAAFIRHSTTPDGKLLLDEIKKEVAATQKVVNEKAGKK